MAVNVKQWTSSSSLATSSEECGMCASSERICSKYGVEALQLTRSYQGTGKRLRRLLAKASRGDKITVGVIGGSVSEAIGVPEESKWHSIVSTWFKTMFPNNEVELVNGAVPGRGSEYFQSCHGEHISHDVDLVIIELGINDWKPGAPYDHDMESLVRALLAYPRRPAIIFAQSFALTLPALATGADTHLSVANYYDLPVINLRNWLLPEILHDSSLKNDYFFADRDGTGQHLDYLHISIIVHIALGELISALLDQQLCLLRHGPRRSSALNIDHPWPTHYDSAERTPRLRLLDRWDDTQVVPTPNSKCLSLNSPHVGSQLTFNETASTGWRKWDDDIPWRNVKSYLRGDKAGDRIVFNDIELVEGTWTLYYLRSAKKQLGNLRCWVDGDEAGAIYVEGAWERQMDVGEVLPMHTGLAPGRHTISCEIDQRTNDPQGGHMFLIIALMFV